MIISEYIVPLLMGIIQGFTEFLPISSSGHLFLTESLFSAIRFPLVFIIMLHIATLGAVLIFTRKYIVRILIALLNTITRKGTKDDYASLSIIIMIILSTLVTAPFGFAIRKIIVTNEHLSLLVGISFICTAIIVILPCILKRHQNTDHTIDDRQSVVLPKVQYIQAIIIGMAQGIAVMPGISRSGITISIAILLGLSYKDAAYYSFLLAIPAILASFVISIPDLSTLNTVLPIPSIIISMCAAFFTGLLGLSWIAKLTKNKKLWMFSWYLVPLGVITLLYW